MALLDRTPGAVACGHCRGLGADAVCPCCSRPVCNRCLGGQGCAAPHPWELRLGTGLRLRNIDENGELGFVSFLMDDDGAPRNLANHAVLTGFPTHHQGLEVRYFGPCAFGRGLMLQRCATFTRQMTSDGTEIFVDVDPLLLVARPTPRSVQETRFAARRKRKEVLVLHLASGQQQILRGHTDRVHFVRFIGNGQRLVTADKDNRVIFWPRSGDRLVTARRGA